MIGFTGGLVCNMGCKVGRLIGVDDALDTFGVHGVGYINYILHWVMG